MTTTAKEDIEDKAQSLGTHIRNALKEERRS
jgi:hypothetical protein